MEKHRRLFLGMLALAGMMMSPAICPAQAPAPPAVESQWLPCGWGGGGYYWSAVFHPSKDGVIYLGGDVAGVYKSEDHGKKWRLINNGLVDYGVYSLAVDPTHPSTVYAATQGGLCKSEDEGEHWHLLPGSEPAGMRLTGERSKSVRAVAVNPRDGNIVYAASPAGKIFKSTDGGHSWRLSYEAKLKAELAETRGIQFGKVNGAFYGGFWCPVQFPPGVAAADYQGLGFVFRGDGSRPNTAFLILTLPGGAKYRSKNVQDIFSDSRQRSVPLGSADFVIDPDYAAAHATEAAALPPTPNWPLVNRIDFACSGPLPNQSFLGRFGKIYGAVTRTPDGVTATAENPIELPIKDLLTEQNLQTNGNIKLLSTRPGSIYCVAVSPLNSNLVMAATNDLGLVASRDAGATWTPLNTPQRASSVAFAATDPPVVYASFFGDGVWKSVDAGGTWSKASDGLPADLGVTEVVVSPANAQDVYAIGATGWTGRFFASHDGGANWKAASSLRADSETNPTLDGNHKGRSSLSTPTNLAINPLHPNELYMSANWRSCWSEDAGATWQERDNGADISVITDIRFHGGRTYVTAMDEGSLVSGDGGNSWRQLWPPDWTVDLSGHNWRVAVDDANGAERILSTCTPWDQGYSARVILSEDGGKSYKVITAGLPDYVVRANTAWGQGHPRALAVDPADSQVIYLGLDGDPTPGKSGGGIFKSVNGGRSWGQLPVQPGCRRVFNGLAVDPTDSRRLYWGACGSGGGVYRSDDGGDSWTYAFKSEQWIFNLMVAPDGTAYAAGQNLWRSTDHGKTWGKVTAFTGNRTIVGMEVNPRDAKTLWISNTTWDSRSTGAVYQTRDGAKSWQDITGDLPYVKPNILRFNPATNELWAGGNGLFKWKLER